VGGLGGAASADHVELIDIALLPPYRNHGIGTGVVRGVLAQADRIGRAVRLHVEKQSRAIRLYERLGFVTCGDVGMYLAMRRG
jgi:ribosomal protein S18 acetylase RimI-like enzyme